MRYDEFIGQSVMEVPTPALLILCDVGHAIRLWL